LIGVAATTAASNKVHVVGRHERLLSQVNRRGDDNRYDVVFHDKLLKNGREVAHELGSCVIVDEATTLANCTMVIRLPADRSPLSSRTRRRSVRDSTPPAGGRA